MNRVMTIPKNLLNQEGLVIIPRSDYEEFLDLKKTIRLIKATSSEKKAIKDGKKQIQQGKYLNLKQLKDELEC